MAKRILGYRTVFNSPQDYSGMSIDSLLDMAVNRRNDVLEIAEHPAIKEVLKDNGKTQEDLLDNYYFLGWTGMDDEICWEIISEPLSLKELLNMRDNNASKEEVFRKFCC